MDKGQFRLEKTPESKHASKREKGSIQPAGSNFQQVLSDPQSASQADVLKLQSEAGNSAVSSWLSSTQTVQREPSTDSQGNLTPEISATIQRARGNGNPLPALSRSRLESSFGSDFGGVRLHINPEADRLSQRLNARAFTIGSDIFFRHGAYAPETHRGERTLRHELAHVVQQNGSASTGQLKLGGPDTSEERQAEQAAASPSSPAAASPASASTIQRVIDYAGIAAAFGGSITAEKVQNWTRDVNPTNHAKIEGILMKGNNILEGEMGVLKIFKVDMVAMAADRASGGQPVVSTAQQPVQDSSSQTSQSPAKDAQTGNPAVKPNDIESYVVQKAKEEKMPSGALLDALKDTVQGDLTKLQPAKVDEAVALFKTRDFDALSKMGVSISHIVAFTGGYERMGVGETTSTDGGITGKIKNAFTGNPQRYQEGKAAGAAEFMQNSLLWSLLSAGGGITANLGLMNYLGMNKDGSSFMSQGDINATELAGGIATNVSATVQSLGMLTRSGVDWANVHQARGFNSNIRGDALRQQSSEATMNMLYGLGGLSSAGLGFAQTAENFQAGGSTNVDTSSLGMSKGILDASISAVSLGSRITKSGIAAGRRSNISGIQYHDSPYLSSDGKQKEASVFPKLKAALVDAQTKKAKGQGLDIGKDATQVGGHVMKSVGYGMGGDYGKGLRIAGAITNVASSLAFPIINKIKGLYHDKQAEKSGYRNMEEYRLDRMRTLETEDESGQKGTVQVRINDVASTVNEVYNDFYKNCRLPPSKQETEVGNLSVSQLLSNTGEYMQLNTVLSSKDPQERREAIKNVLLARTATF